MTRGDWAFYISSIRLAAQNPETMMPHHTLWEGFLTSHIVYAALAQLVERSFRKA